MPQLFGIAIEVLKNAGWTAQSILTVGFVAWVILRHYQRKFGNINGNGQNGKNGMKMPVTIGQCQQNMEKIYTKITQENDKQNERAEQRYDKLTDKVTDVGQHVKDMQGNINIMTKIVLDKFSEN